MSAPHDKIFELFHSKQSYIGDVKACASSNMLRLSSNKTELIHVTSKSNKYLHSLPKSITFGNAKFSLKEFVKNLSFALDNRLTMNAHVSIIESLSYVVWHPYTDS